MIYIGIDVGKASFICVMGYDEKPLFIPIPMINDEINISELFLLIAPHTRRSCFAVIEDVHAIFGSSAKATFEFGRVAGILEALLVAHGIPYAKVKPKEWQKEMWQGIPILKKEGKTSNDTKAMSLMAAQRLFPNVDLRKSDRAKIPDHNKVDAILLCEYCRRKF